MNVHMAQAAAVTRTQGGQAWSPARAFLTASGVFHVVLSSVGLAYNSNFATGAGAASDRIFGVFETNGWHNLAGLVLGATSLVFAAMPERARLGALSLGGTMVVVTLVLLIWDAKTFWIASNAWDQALHALAGIGGLVSGLATRPAPRA